MATEKDFKEAFEEFIAHRITIKHPLTPNAERLAHKTLERIAPGDWDMKIQIIEQSIVGGYRGLFPVKNYTQPHRYGPKSEVSNKSIKENIFDLDLR